MSAADRRRDDAHHARSRALAWIGTIPHWLYFARAARQSAAVVPHRRLDLRARLRRSPCSDSSWASRSSGGQKPFRWPRPFRTPAGCGGTTSPASSSACSRSRGRSAACCRWSRSPGRNATGLERRARRVHRRRRRSRRVSRDGSGGTGTGSLDGRGDQGGGIRAHPGRALLRRASRARPRRAKDAENGSTSLTASPDARNPIACWSPRDTLEVRARAVQRRLADGAAARPRCPTCRSSSSSC